MKGPAVQNGAMRVVVVGAGFAGLAAADELARAGAEVCVLEARDRVGGRVHSVPFAGAVVERGAEWVLPGHSTIRALVERFGLELVLKGAKYGAREPRGGEPVTDEELAEAVARIRELGGDGGGSIEERLAELRLPPAVHSALRARIDVSAAHPADDLEAAGLAESGASFGDFDSHTVEGGNQRIAQALAESLGGAVRLSSPVRRVEWFETGARVSTDHDAVEADSVVLALPASVIGDVAFEPPLPEAKRAALAAVLYGQAAKLFVALREPAPPSATLSVPGRFWCYTQLGPDGLPLPVVGSFAGTPAALDVLSVDSGPERWIAALAELRPDLVPDRSTAMLATWHDDPWTRGAYSARSLVSRMEDEELARPVGCLAFAGEHTAGDWHGLMEGALRSGVRAARDVGIAVGRKA
jgi:monoamine oxidase